jgi:hypothetical protein
MSSEHLPKETFKEHQKDLEQNVLASKLSGGWDKFKKGQLVSYRVMAISLIAVTAIGLFFYVRSGKRAEVSARWSDLEAANSLDRLDDYAKKYPNTTAANIAQLHAARYKLANLGIEALGTRDAAAQKKAVENIESARDTFEQLIGAFKDDPVMKVQCILGRAKAEAALVGIYKDGNTGDFRGTVPALIEWLDKLAAEAADTPWGEDAKKFSESLRSGNAREELERVQRGLYTIEKLPDLPPGFGKPKSPLDTPDTPKLPGLPGGDPKLGPLAPKDGDKPKDEKNDAKDAPKAPDATPPKTPDATPPKAPDPKAKDAAAPKPAEPAPKPPEKKP